MQKAFTRTFIAATFLTASQASMAAVVFDANVTPDVIFGSGNTNGSFTVDQTNGVELGLRGKLRHNASGSPENTFNSNGDGTYSFNAGVAPTQSSPTAEWSFEWSINTNYDGSTGWFLDDLSYELGLDTDPSQGVAFGGLELGLSNPFDPINGSYADHAIGTNATLNGDGSVAADAAGYASLIGGNNVAQNSWKPHWFISGFDPTIDGTYDIYLAAFGDSGQVARTDIQVIVGAGGTAAVPVPGTLALLGLGFAGFGFLRRKKNRA